MQAVFCDWYISREVTIEKISDLKMTKLFMIRSKIDNFG